MITYRVLTTQEEYEQVVDMEMAIWGTDERGTITAHTLMVLNHTGGNVIGAFDGDQMVGCTIAFAMFGEKRLWSHIAGVLPTHQRQGIGYQLKHKQREWALERGYTHMSWSFDPLMAPNAHFNLCLLGAKTNRYNVNFYGVMTDKINAGMPTDRFEMLWALTEEKSESQSPENAPFLLQMDAENQPQKSGQPTEMWHFVEIPPKLSAIRDVDLDLAIKWKIAVRETLKPAFEAGYWAVDFMRCDGRNWYVLQRTD